MKKQKTYKYAVFYKADRKGQEITERLTGVMEFYGDCHEFSYSDIKEALQRIKDYHNADEAIITNIIPLPIINNIFSYEDKPKLRNSGNMMHVDFSGVKGHEDNSQGDL